VIAVVAYVDFGLAPTKVRIKVGDLLFYPSGVLLSPNLNFARRKSVGRAKGPSAHVFGSSLTSPLLIAEIF
jgi:hypothetical protein